MVVAPKCKTMTRSGLEPRLFDTEHVSLVVAILSPIIINIIINCFFISHGREAERDAKLDTLRDKMNAVQLVLERCSGKLENLKSSGAPNDLPGVKEQQNIVKVLVSKD